MSDYRLPDGTIPVLISSDTVDGVRAEAAAIAAYLRQHPHVDPNAVADMLFRTRVARRRRALAMVNTRAELLDALAAIVEDIEHPAVVRTVGVATARRVGLVFPGQGSQRAGMGALYYQHSEAYRSEIDACAAHHEEFYGHSGPLHYLLGHTDEFEDAVWEVQPALMFHMSGLAAMWRAAGVEPAATIGHSQGELAAGSVSAVMTRRDAVLAVTQRSLLVERVSPGGYSMAVLGMDRDTCEALLARNSGWAELSVVNSPHILAISGDRSTILEMVETATAKGQFAREIRVSYPAHTSIVASLRAEFEEFLGEKMSAEHFVDSDIPCYGATLGTAITSDLRHDEYWYWNLRNRVRFDRAIVAAAADGIDTFVEVSEHPMLMLAVQENLTLVPPTVPPGWDVATGSPDFRVLGTSLRTATGLGEFTRNLATLAAHDLNYRWDALRVASDGSTRLPLLEFPNTVMHPQRLWMTYRSVDEQPPAVAGPRPSRLAETWLRLDRRSLLPPRDLLLVDPTGQCVDQVAALSAAADRHGGTATVCDPAAPPPLTAYDTIVVVLPASADTDAPTAVDHLAEFFATAWLPPLGPNVTDCWLLTVNGETVDATPPQLFHAAVSSGFRSVGMEHIGTAFRHLDIHADADPGAIVRALHTKSEPQLALRSSGLYAKRLTEAAAAEPIGHIDLDHVVIVGGTGTLGLTFAEHLAGRGAGRITLLSRSGETAAVAERLRAIRAGGVTDVVVAACDVSDEAAVRRVAAATADRPVSLLMHAAVNYVGAELAEVTAEKVREMASSKIMGTDVLLRTLPMTDDCRIVLCSSAASIFGGRGQILYASINRMLDAWASHLRAGGVNAVAMQWGIWDIPGPLHAVGLDRVTAVGVVPMDPAAALAVGLTEHALSGVPENRLVAAADWSQVHELLSAVGFGPVLTELIEPAVLPAVSLSPAAPPSPPPPLGTLSDQVRVALGKVMGSDGVESIDSAVPLVALGLDSLQALDFRKRVQVELNRELPVAAILGGASLDDVVRLMTSNT